MVCHGVRGLLCRRAYLPAGLGAAVALASPAAQAQEGFALNRFEPAESGSRWIAADSLDLSGHLRPSVGLVGDWAHKPLVAYAANGDEVAGFANDQLFVHMRGSLTLADRVRVGVNAPLLVYQNGSDVVVGGDEYRIQRQASFGDLRLSADVRLFGEQKDALTVATGIAVHLPTGSADHYTGDGAVRLQPRVQVAGEIGAFVYAGRTGVHIRTENKEVGGESMGSELLLGAAAGVQLLEKKLLVGPMLAASTVITAGSNGFFDRQTTPFEVQLGAHYDVSRELRIGTGFGPGLSRGVGAPAARWVVSADWSPRPEPPPAPVLIDSDGDGLADGLDACPNEHGPRTTDPKTDGCPPPPDADGDGIFDAQDACVERAGLAAPNDPSRHGCPPLADQDRDGIADPEDACVHEAGVKNLSDAALNGCPLPKDSDGDGFLDEVDACPGDPGVAHADPARNGCPKLVITSERIQLIDRIEFDTGQASLRPEANDVLSAVAEALLSNPQITRLSVEGHTDSQGGAQMNRELSTRRAAAVMKWLLQQGIAPERLVSRGWGADRPLQSNDSPEGRRNNRRVEFQVLEMDGAPVNERDADTGGAR